MKILYHRIALKELSKLPNEVINRFGAVFEDLMHGKRLPLKKFRKMSGTRKLYEAKVKLRGNEYRGFGGYIKSGFFVVLFFTKKSKKTPRNILNTALKRLSD